MKGLGQSALALVLGGCLVLMFTSLIVSSSAEMNAVKNPAHRERIFSAHRQRRDIDLEGLPPEIREKIAASRLRSGTRDMGNGTPNCWVEVEVPKRLGGQCRRIENMPACAVNDNLYINHPDCM